MIGQIDETVDYTPLRAAPAPLKLGLSKVRNVNSVGVRAFLQFVLGAASRGLEFHECSPAFLDMINIYPSSLGDPPDPAIVKSIVLIYRCVACAKDEAFLLKIDYVPGGEEPALPLRSCPRCKAVLKAGVEPEDLFTYMIAGD